MKKYFKHILSLLVALVLFITPVLTACGKGDSGKKGKENYYSITFMVDGSTYQKITQLEGSSITPPTEPYKDGYTFLDWYTDETYTVSYSVPTVMPSQDVTVYGRFRSNTHVTVTFEVNGGEGIAATVQGYAGEPFTLPKPTKAGHVFEGWYQDASFGQAFTGNLLPDENTTLYAKWSRDANKVLLTLVMGDEIREVYVNKNSKVNQSTLPSSLPGYRLTGWVNAENQAVSFPFNATADMRLIALYYSTGLEVEQGSVVGYTGTSTKIVIPEKTAEGVTITGIGFEDANGDGYGVFAEDFAMAQKIVSIQLPDTITHIYNNAFSNLTSLETVNIPTGVQYIGDGLFENCPSLKHVDFTGNAAYPFEGGALYNTNKTTLIAFFGSVDSFTIPATVTTISSAAFSYMRIGRLVVPATVNTIADTAFRYTLAGELVFNAAVTQIATDGFRNATELVSVDMSGSTVQKIGNSAFSGCTKLATVLLPDTIEQIEALAFENCVSLEDIDLKDAVIADGSVFSGAGIREYVIPDGTQEIAEGMFINWGKLEKVEIPESVTRVGAKAFNGCSALKELSFTGDANIESIGEAAFFGCGFEELDLSDFGSSLASIETEAFAHCESLKKVYIPDSVHSIGTSTFNGCAALEEITLPFIGLYDQVGMLAMLQGILDSGRGLSELGKSWYDALKVGGTAARDAFIERIILGSNAAADFLFGAIFGQTSYSNALPYGQKVSDTGNSFVFYLPGNLKKIVVNSDCVPAFGFYNSYTFTSPDFHLGGKIEFTNKVKAIGANAFAFADGFVNLVLPENLEVVMDYAFEWIDTLKTVTVPAMVNYLGVGAFSYNYKLTDVRILGTATGNDAIELGQYLFRDDKVLENVVQGNGNETGVKLSAAKIAPYVFADCVKINRADLRGDITFVCLASDVTIEHKGWTSLSCGVFSGCKGLTEVLLGESPKCVYSVGNADTGITTMVENNSLPGNLFNGCANLTKINANGTSDVNIPAVDKIHGYAFVGTGIKEFHASPATWYIGAMVFTNSAVEEVYLPGVTTMESSAFRQTSKLKKVVLSYKLEKLNFNTFYEARGLDTLGYYDANNYNTPDPVAFATVPTADAIGWKGNGTITCKNEEVVFSDNLSDISQFDIFLRTAVKKITLPEKATAIGNLFLSECPNLEEVNIPATVQSIGTQAFAYGGLRRINFEVDENGESALEVIDSYLFHSCPRLTEVVFPEGVKYIGTEVFVNCTALESVVLPSTTVMFGRGRAFKDCDKLMSLTMLSPVPVEADAGSSEESTFFYSSALARSYTPEELIARGLHIYVPREAIPAYQEYRAVWNYSGGSDLRAQRGFGNANIAERQFGWMSYANTEGLFVGVDVGTYLNGTNKLSLTNEGGTAYLSGTVASKTYDKEALTAVTDGYRTSDGTTLAISGKQLTVTPTGGTATTYNKITGAYIDMYAWDKDAAEGNPNRRVQYQSFLLLAEDGEVIFTHFQKSTGYSLKYEIYTYEADDYFGTWKILDDGSIEIEVVVGNAGVLILRLVPTGNGYQMQVRATDGSFSASARQTVRYATNINGTQTATEDFAFTLR